MVASFPCSAGQHRPERSDGAERACQANDLAELVSETVQLKRVGSSLKGLCPFHPDRNPSLDVDPQRGLWHCFGCGAGGDTVAWVERTRGLPRSEAISWLYERAGLPDPAREPARRKPQANRREVARYDYVDAEGRLLYQVVRFEPKDFRQRRPDGQGGWAWDLRGVDRVLYRLPEVLAEAQAGGTVWVVEGEKDADALRAIGVVATTAAGGAKAPWLSQYTQALQGADGVVVVADADPPGYARARVVRDALRAGGLEAWVVRAAQGKDAADHLGAGLGLDQFVPLSDAELDALAAPEPEANGKVRELRVLEGGPGADEAPVRQDRSDLGNARRLVARHGEDFRWVAEWDKFLVWVGNNWQLDIDGQLERWAKAEADTMAHEAAESQDKQLFGWAIRSKSASGLANAVRVARTEPGVPVRVAELDRDPMLLGVTNGVVDLRTGQLQASRREDFLTKSTRVEFDPTATCPLWQAFLARALPDPEVREFIQRFVGYCFSGDVGEQVLLILHGSGANGKSVFLETLLRLLGDYAAAAPPRLLFVSRNERHPTEIADLHGKRLVTSYEVGEFDRLDEPLVKQLTGGDKLKARRMREDFWEFTPTHKLVMACNHKPLINGTDEGIWRRVKLVPFDVTIPSEERDPQLARKLQSELSGILTWAVAGCLWWQAEGLRPPEAVAAATERYRAESDILGQFLAECCVQDARAEVRSTVLYQAYVGWCEQTGLRASSQKVLSQRLVERGFRAAQNRTHQSVWLGLGLLSDREEPGDEG